jgi:two-component system KDP operon response regulator KdpE
VSSRPRILVIDDEPQIHRFLTPALEAAGFEPIRADTAATGLQEIARRAPDAVILDLGLPDMDGGTPPQEEGRRHDVELQPTLAT